MDICKRLVRADEDAILIKFPWAYPREELRVERIPKEWSSVLALTIRSKASAVLTGTADFSLMTSTSGISATEHSRTDETQICCIQRRALVLTGVLRRQICRAGRWCEEKCE